MIFCGQAGADPEHVTNAGILVGLVPGASLHHNAEGGDRSVVLDSGDSYTVLLGSNLKKILT